MEEQLYGQCHDEGVRIKGKEKNRKCEGKGERVEIKWNKPWKINNEVT
jgi:hypothetical protein